MALGITLILPFSARTETPIQSASEIEYPPFSVVDATGRADGFSVELMLQSLENLGYKALTSANPLDAIGMAREHPSDIDLLMTDVVLPEMSGKDLAVEISRIRSGIRTLYLSGYTANVIAHQGVLDRGVHFIGKPFTPESLGRKVREAMGARKAAGGKIREPRMDTDGHG